MISKTVEIEKKPKGNIVKNGSKWFSVSEDSRSWEDFYRKRWSYD